MPADDSLYRQLQIQLDRYPIGYPPTKSGVEIEILRYFFTPMQAKIALCLTLRSIPIGRIRKNLKDFKLNFLQKNSLRHLRKCL